MRRVVSGLQVCDALARLILATPRRRPRLLWLGDSHTVFFNQTSVLTPLAYAGDDGFVWYLGPRLMWSLGVKGFPRKVHRFARILRFVHGANSFVPVLVAGEIDVRCHLVSRLGSPEGNLSFVADYVLSGRRLASDLGARAVVFAVPVPPSSVCPVNPQFPIEGSIEDRVAAFEALREALRMAVTESRGLPDTYLLDATADLVDDTDALNIHLTDDGCHVNPDGAYLVHGHLPF